MSVRNWLSHPPFGVGLILAAVIVAGGINNHIGREERSAAQEDAKTQQATAQQPPAVVQVTPRLPLQDSADDKASDHGNQIDTDDGFWVHLGELLSNWSNVAIAAFTVVLTGVSIWQGRVLHRTLLATETSADAAVKAADAAVAAVLPVVEVSGLYIARNLVGFQRAIMPGGVPPRGSWLSIGANNVGHGPATIVGACARWLVDDVLPQQPDYPAAPPFSIALREGQTTNLDLNDVDISLTDAQQQQVNDGQSSLWLYGRLTYEDALENVYDVGFAARWQVTQRPPDMIPAGFNLAHDPRYHYRRKRS